MLARNGDVYFTCIPHLWKLRDKDGDGRADERQSLHYGYGVRFAFFGHDLHGLTIGPDGRLYFSIGDRGFNVKTKEGKRLINPDSGAVLRCELDGSNLEIFCIGLAQPAGAGVRRLRQPVHVRQQLRLAATRRTGTISSKAATTAGGWTISTCPTRGPWNREKLWHPQHEGQAAYIVPPHRQLHRRPVGHHVLSRHGAWATNTKATSSCATSAAAPANSGIRTWTVKPKGASFELADAAEVLWKACSPPTATSAPTADCMSATGSTAGTARAKDASIASSIRRRRTTRA